MISTISPLPRMVAPRMPASRETCGPDALDHHLLAGRQIFRVHRQAVFTGAQQHHRRLLALVQHHFLAEQLAQRAQHHVADRRHLELALQHGVEQRRRFEAAHLLDHAGRDRVAAPSHARQHDLRDGQRERQVQVKRVKRPPSEATVTRPPNAESSERTTSMPTPRPASSVTSVAVEKPGANTRSINSRSVAGWS
jgi:chromosome condensin MukBEF MukE localization factor